MWLSQLGLLDHWKASFLPPPNRCSAPLSSNRPRRNERLIAAARNANLIPQARGWNWVKYKLSLGHMVKNRLNLMSPLIACFVCVTPVCEAVNLSQKTLLYISDPAASQFRFAFHIYFPSSTSSVLNSVVNGKKLISGTQFAFSI